jgi:flagellar basal body P-ring formation protein FlgA
MNIKSPVRRRSIEWTLALCAAGILRFAAMFGAETTQSAADITTVDEIRAAATQTVMALASDTGQPVSAQAVPLDSRLRLRRCASALHGSVTDDWQSQRYATVRISCDAPVRWNIYVRVVVNSERRMLIARHDLARGSQLAAGDFESRVTTVAGSGAHYIADASLLSGMRLRLPLAAGGALSIDAVEQAPLVRRGQQVTVLARAEGLEIRAAGIAMGDGRLSDRINVQNQSTHRLVEAVVLSSELVEVGL